MKTTLFYDLGAPCSSGERYEFAQLRGKVVLIVNVASRCAFSPQYKSLQGLYDKYRDQGLVILGFPCNQFGGQEPAGDASISNSCQLNYSVTFPLMKKSEVNGPHANEVYQYLKTQKRTLGLARIKWNFEKFLVNREGEVLHRWVPWTQPEAIEGDIARALG